MRSLNMTYFWGGLLSFFSHKGGEQPGDQATQRRRPEGAVQRGGGEHLRHPQQPGDQQLRGGPGHLLLRWALQAGRHQDLPRQQVAGSLSPACMEGSILIGSHLNVSTVGRKSFV